MGTVVAAEAKCILGRVRTSACGCICMCVWKVWYWEVRDRGSFTHTVPATKTTSPTLKVTLSTQPFPLSLPSSFIQHTHTLSLCLSLALFLIFCLCSLSHPLFLYSVVSFLPFTHPFLIMHGPHFIIKPMNSPLTLLPSPKLRLTFITSLSLPSNTNYVPFYLGGISHLICLAFSWCSSKSGLSKQRN